MYPCSLSIQLRKTILLFRVFSSLWFSVFLQEIRSSWEPIIEPRMSPSMTRTSHQNIPSLKRDSGRTLCLSRCRLILCNDLFQKRYSVISTFSLSDKARKMKWKIYLYFSITIFLIVGTIVFVIQVSSFFRFFGVLLVQRPWRIWPNNSIVLYLSYSFSFYNQLNKKHSGMVFFTSANPMSYCAPS